MKSFRIIFFLLIMHCKTFFISLLPVLLPVIHAGTIGEVNGANQVLADQAASFDSNVRELGTLSALLKVQVHLASMTNPCPTRSHP